MASASSLAFRQLCHGEDVTRFRGGSTRDSSSSNGVPISENSIYDAKAKSNPPSHSIVIVTLILAVVEPLENVFEVQHRV